MSFMIAAIYKNIDVYIVSDSQITNRFTGIIRHNADRIKEINKSVGVVCAGAVPFGREVLFTLLNDYSTQEYILFQQSDIARDIAAASEKFLPVWTEGTPNFVPKPAFLVAGYDSLNRPGISTIILHQKSVELCARGLKAGDWRFLVVGPKDISADSCIQLCTQFLSRRDNRNKDPESILASLVDLISQHSVFADSYPKLWRAQKAYWKT